MANNKKPTSFHDGVRLVPEATPTLSEEGTIKYDSATGKAKLRGGASTETLVTEDKAATLTNKTIDCDDNTVQDLPLTAIKTVVGDASKFLVRNGSGVPTSSNTVPSGTVVGTTDTQTLTGKTIVVASNTITTAASGNLAATELNTALAELQADVDTRALDSDFDTHVSDTTTHGTTGNIVGTSDTQTLTNKTISTDDNTIESGVATVGKVLTADGAGGTEWSEPTAARTSSTDIQNLALVASIDTGALTIALKNNAGNDPSAGDPVKISFRDATLTTGTYVQRSVEAATPVVISSGSTLGNTNTIYIYAMDNAGTVELAVAAIPRANPKDESSLITTLAEGGAGAADNLSAIYSTTARTNLPFRLIGRVNAVQSSGVWSSVTSIDLRPFQSPQFNQGVAQLNSYAIGKKIREITGITNLGSSTFFETDESFDSYFAIPESGVYSISYIDNFSAASDFGISKNTTQTTTSISSITDGEILAVSHIPTADKPGNCSWLGYLSKSDKIRFHTEGTSQGSLGASCRKATITRIS